MSDFLVDLSANRSAQKVIKTLGLPLSLPPVLERTPGPLAAYPLHSQRVLFGGGDGTKAFEVALDIARAAGASTFGTGPAAETLGLADASGRCSAIVYDATGAQSIDDLRTLYTFFHATLGSLDRHGRVVVLGPDPEGTRSAQASAVGRALDGFVRSLAKEIGRKGATANRVVVEKGGEPHIGPALRYLLSPRSAFVSGQTLHVGKQAVGRKPIDTTAPDVRALEGKVALITGAARGIGEATARRLAEEGAQVLAVDRPSEAERLQRLCDEIGGVPILQDLLEANAVPALVQSLRADNRGLDIVVHNAGVTRDKTIARMKPDAWDMVLRINLGVILELDEAIEEELLHDNARVLYLSSVGGIAGNPGQTNYAATKAALIAYAAQRGRAWAKAGTTANAIAPGLIETPMTAAMPAMIRQAARRLSNLNQGGLPEDIAEAITFLSLPSSQGITGQTLRVCGGALVGA